MRDAMEHRIAVYRVDRSGAAVVRTAAVDADPGRALKLERLQRGEYAVLETRRAGHTAWDIVDGRRASEARRPKGRGRA